MKKFTWLHSVRLLDTSQVLKVQDVSMFNSNVEFTNIFSLVMNFIGLMGYQPWPQSQDLKHFQGFFSATRHWMDRHVISWRKKTGVGKCGERMRKVVRANIRVLQRTTKHIYVLLLWARRWFVWVPAKTCHGMNAWILLGMIWHQRVSTPRNNNNKHWRTVCPTTKLRKDPPRIPSNENTILKIIASWANGESIIWYKRDAQLFSECCLLLACWLQFTTMLIELLGKMLYLR